MAAPATPEAFSLTYSMFSLLLILFACVELGDAASAVHVYRLIQYDLAGVPLGSRVSSLNHHAVSFPLDPDADLSRSALVVPLLDLDLSFLRGTIIFLSILIQLVMLFRFIESEIRNCFRRVFKSGKLLNGQLQYYSGSSWLT